MGQSAHLKERLFSPQALTAEGWAEFELVQSCFCQFCKLRLTRLSAEVPLGKIFDSHRPFNPSSAAEDFGSFVMGTLRAAEAVNIKH